MKYTMMQVVRETGLSYETLKFYCNEGLVPEVERDRNNRRIFSEAMVRWIKDLSCLKKCSMSIQEMKAYLRLCLEGPSSIPVRQAMLAHKKELLEKQMEELKESLAYIDWKQEFYDDVQSGRRPYISNLLPSKGKDEKS